MNNEVLLGPGTRRIVSQIKNSTVRIDESMEKVVTGNDFNRAKDGLGRIGRVSNLNADILSLSQGVSNTLNSISLFEAAEIALEEASDILARIRELAVQATGGTITSATRAALEGESGLLLQELGTISADTKFNKRRLLDGSFASTPLQVGINAGESFNASLSSSAPEVLGAYSSFGPTRAALTAGASIPINTTTSSENITLTGNSGTTTISVDAEESAESVATKVNALASITEIEATAVTNAVLFSTNAGSENYSLGINGISTSSFAISSSSVSDAVEKINLISSSTGVSASATTANQVLLSDVNGGDITIVNNSAGTNLDIQAVQADGATTQGSAISLAGTGGTDSSRIIGNLRLFSNSAFEIYQAGDSSVGYSLTGTASLQALSDIDLTTTANASESIAAIDAASDQISAILGNIGAYVNRLSFGESLLNKRSDVLSEALENLVGADLAKQAAKLAKAIVVREINLSLLSQANANEALVLKLLDDAA